MRWCPVWLFAVLCCSPALAQGVTSDTNVSRMGDLASSVQTDLMSYVWVIAPYALKIMALMLGLGLVIGIMRFVVGVIGK